MSAEDDGTLCVDEADEDKRLPYTFVTSGNLGEDETGIAVASHCSFVECGTLAGMSVAIRSEGGTA